MTLKIFCRKFLQNFIVVTKLLKQMNMTPAHAPQPHAAARRRKGYHLKLFWNKKRDIFNHEDLPGESFSSEYNDLLQMVLNLPDKCKAPMYLHYYEGYSCKQIGEILGCKESAIKMRLKRGRELLKMNLEEDKQYGCY